MGLVGYEGKAKYFLLAISQHSAFFFLTSFVSIVKIYSSKVFIIPYFLGTSIVTLHNVNL